MQVCSKNWLSLDSLARLDLSEAAHHWLADPGSLTKRLKILTDGNILFRVQRNGWGSAIDEERAALGISMQESTWLREIEWVYQGAVWVKARVVIPEASFLGEGEALRTLGDGPIGELLFSDPGLQRSEFAVQNLQPSHFYYQLACQQIQHQPESLLARRSVFYFHNNPLLVSEVFFPALFEYSSDAVDVQ